MADEKDRLGEKLKDVERGREDQYFAEQDRILLEKLRAAKEREAREEAVRQDAGAAPGTETEGLRGGLVGRLFRGRRRGNP